MDKFWWERMLQLWLMPPYSVILVGLAVLLLLIFIFLVVLFLVLRARRRERMISNALAAGQPELAIYVAQGPRRIVAFLVLLGAALLASYGWDMHSPEVYPVALIVAVFCLVVIFRRPKVRPPSTPQAPPGVQAASAQAQAASAQAQAAPPPQQPVGPPQPGILSGSNGILETVLAIVVAVLVLLAGLILLRYSPLLVLAAGLIALAFLVLSRDTRRKCAKAVSRQAGRFSDWLNRKAGNGDSS